MFFVHNQFKTRLTLSLTIAVSAAVALLAATFWLRFDINKRAAAIREAKKELAFRFETAELTATLKKDFETAKAQRVLLETLLPPQDKLINFSKEVNELAKKNKIDTNFSFGQEVAAAEQEPGYISFTITANATLADWLNFIESLERLSYFVNFNSFNLVADGDQFRSIINGKIFSQ